MKNTDLESINRKQKRYIIFLIIVIMGLLAFVGCARAEEPEIIDDYPWGGNYENDPAENDETNDTEDSPTASPDFHNHLTHIDDIIVARANGINIYQRDVTFEILRAKGPLLWEYFEMFGDEWDEETSNEFISGLMTGIVDSDLIDFDRELRDGQTFGQVLLEEATQIAAEFKIYLALAHEVGIELTDDGIIEINFHIDDLIWEFGQEELDELLREDGIRGTSHLAEIYANHWRLDNLIYTFMTEPDAFARFEMHMTEESCDAYARATAILDRLNAGEDFTELLLLYGEDPGMMTFPDGYTFVTWQMVPEFSEGTIALEIGEMSGLVKSDFGYHIILRVEPDPDNMMQWVDVPVEELLGAKHILIQSNEQSLEDRMLEAISVGLDELTSNIDVELLSALWDIDVRW